MLLPVLRIAKLEESVLAKIMPKVFGLESSLALDGHSIFKQNTNYNDL